MGLLDPQNIIEANWPSLAATAAVGLHPLTICRKKLFGYLYSLIFLLSYYIMIYLTFDYANNIYDSWKSINKSLWTKQVELKIYIITMTLIVVYSLFNSIRMNNLNSCLCKFDEKLKLLNIKFNYKISMINELYNVFGIGLFTCLNCLIEYNNLLTAGRTNLYFLMSITNQLPVLVNCFAIIPFVMMCTKVTKRNEAINDLIPTMTNTAKNLPGIHSADMNNVFRVNLARESYGLLCNVITVTNEYYGPILLMSFMIFFIEIFLRLHILCSIWQFNDQNGDLMCESLGMLFYIGKCIYIIHGCHCAHAERKRTTTLLYEAETNTDHHLLREEMESFARQVESTNISFSVCNLFVIDYVILLKIILAMATHILLQLQFHRE